ncbi:MAG: DsbA family oxidoreductase [Sterolibacterium sp.]
MTTHLKIDFVSDISCPWCAIGLSALELALELMGDDYSADLRFQPFELNPHMPHGGQDLAEHMTSKYGYSPEQQAQIFESICQSGAAMGFTFHTEKWKRIYNTFDAHRLLHWAGLSDTRPAGRQPALKKALLQAYFTHGECPESHEVLLRLAGESGLDVARAKEILIGDEYAIEVREKERFYIDAGIHSVPSCIINNKYLISGGQPVEVFEQALRQIASAQ